MPHTYDHSTWLNQKNGPKYENNLGSAVHLEYSTMRCIEHGMFSASPS